MKVLISIFLLFWGICLATETPIQEQFEKTLQELTRNLGDLIGVDTITDPSSFENVFLLTDQLHTLINKNPEQLIHAYGKNTIQNLYTLIDELSVFGYISKKVSVNKFEEICETLTWKHTRAEEIIYEGKRNAENQVNKIYRVTCDYEKEYFEILKKNRILSPLNKQILFLFLALQKASVDSLPNEPLLADLKQTLEKVKQAFRIKIDMLGILLTTTVPDLIWTFYEDITVIHWLI
jgi:hypothetical protein